jgi:transcriptional regulator with XRE-family HTH domain
MKYTGTISEVLAQNVKNLRLAQNLTQDQLAEIAGISGITISKIERQEQWPNPDTIERLAKTLQIHIYQLFIDEEKEQIIPADTYEDMKKSLVSAVEQHIYEQKWQKPVKSTKKRATKSSSDQTAVSYDVTHK